MTETEDIKKCCGANCSYATDNPAQPCWGDINAVDDVQINGEWVWIHACEGHSDYPDYIPKEWKR